MVSIKPVPDRLKYLYPPGSSHDTRLTARVEDDARTGVERLEGAVGFLAGSFPDLLGELQRHAEQGDSIAALYIERFTLALENIGALSVNNGAEKAGSSEVEGMVQ